MTKHLAESIPHVYVDAAEFHTQPFTFNVLCGVHDLGDDAEPTPTIRLSMSPTFAITFASALIDALEPYLSEDDSDGDGDGDGDGDDSDGGSEG